MKDAFSKSCSRTFFQHIEPQEIAALKLRPASAKLCKKVYPDTIYFLAKYFLFSATQ
jgi:hypothetical protein